MVRSRLLLALWLLQEADVAEGLPVWGKGRQGTGTLTVIPTAAAAGDIKDIWANGSIAQHVQGPAFPQTQPVSTHSR